LAIAVMHFLHHRRDVLLQLRSYLTVLEEGSVHRAATRLNLSQSALSRQMQALEHERGGDLLERSSTGVKPTRAGRELAKRMGAFLASFDANLLAVRRIIRGEAGELRIGYLASAFQEYLDPALKKLRRLHPKTKVKLLDLFPGELIAALRQGEIDLALTQDGGDLLRQDFHTRKLAVIKSYACLPEEHPLASRKSVRIAELKGETFITSPDAEVPGLRQRLMRFCRTFGKFRPKMVEISGGVSDGFSAIANDGAVAILPAFLRHQSRPGVVMVPICDEGATWDLFLAWQPGHTPEPLRTLLAALPSS
jgi:DNA-binding transcriptional LysR family regulator